MGDALTSEVMRLRARGKRRAERVVGMGSLGGGWEVEVNHPLPTQMDNPKPPSLRQVEYPKDGTSSLLTLPLSPSCSHLLSMQSNQWQTARRSTSSNCSKPSAQARSQPSSLSSLISQSRPQTKRRPQPSSLERSSVLPVRLYLPSVPFLPPSPLTQALLPPDETVEIVLGNRSVNPNKPYMGLPALHLAAELGRADIGSFTHPSPEAASARTESSHATLVKLLLDQPSIDDTLLDNQGRTCLDAAASEQVIQTILGPFFPITPVRQELSTEYVFLLLVGTDSRAALQADYLTLLSAYIQSPHPNGHPNPANPLLDLLRSPRAAILDINALDEHKGVSLLHEAVRRKDLTLVKFLALERGADVFVRDKRGKSAYDGNGGSDDVSNLLKQGNETLFFPSTTCLQRIYLSACQLPTTRRPCFKVDQMGNRPLKEATWSVHPLSNLQPDTRSDSFCVRSR